MCWLVYSIIAFIASDFKSDERACESGFDLKSLKTQFTRYFNNLV